MTHDRDGVEQVESGGVDGHEDLAHTLVRSGVGGSHHHHDGKGCADGTGGELLVAIDYVVVSIPHDFRPRA